MARKKIKNESRVETAVIPGRGTVTMQLVNIEFYPRMSDETLAFNADLKVVSGDEFKAECENDGHGGCTDIRVWDRDTEIRQRHWAVLADINKYYQTQDDLKFMEVAKRMGWKVDKIPKRSLEDVVNDMLADWCDANNL